MFSFTSSFRPESDTKLVITAVLALLFGTLIILYRPPLELSGLPSEVFWARKALALPDYDVVVAGDSRVYRDVSSSHMESILSGKNVLNFGFSSMGLHREYLESAAARFSPDAAPRILVLGVTPYSLTPKAFLRTEYKDTQKQKRDYSAAELQLIMWLDYFRPFEEEEIVGLAMGKEVKRYIQRLHPGGWIESTSIPENPQEALKGYRLDFKNNTVVEENAKAVIDSVSDFSKQGVMIFGFRPPVHSSLFDLEEELSGFDEEHFKEAFQEAGGYWLDVPLDDYRSYDGSHLVNTSAIELSLNLARQIESTLP